MQRVSLATYVYLFLALGLFCFIVFIDHKNPGTQEKEENLTRLFDLANVEASGLEITSRHGTFVFRKEGGHWKIKSPIVAPADGGVIEGIVDQIRLAEVRRHFNLEDSTEAHLKAWGLMPPEARVIIHAENNKNFELLIGRDVAVTDLIFVKVARKNEPVKQVPNTVKLAVDKDLTDFRSRNVFDFSAPDVNKISSQINSTLPTSLLSCEIELKDKTWTLHMPVVARAATSSVDALLAQFTALHVVDFVTDDATNLIQFGMATPTSTLGVKTKKGEEIILQIGSAVPTKPDQVYAQLLKSTSVFTLNKNAVEDLLRAMPNVRDRRVLSFIPGNVTQFIFSRSNNKIDLKRSKGVWTIAGDGSALIDPTKMNDLLSRISTLETTPVLKDSPAPADLKNNGLDQPSGKLTVKLEDGVKNKSEVTLEIGNEQNKLVFVRNSTEPCVYTVKATDLAFLPNDVLSLRDARAIDLNYQTVRGLMITTASGQKIVMTRSQGGSWTVENTKDRMVDTTLAEPYVSLFSQLQVKQWLGPVLPNYGLNKPILKITVITDNGAVTVLDIGPALPNGSHPAVLENHDVAFAMQEGDFDIFNGTLLKPIPQVSPPGITPTNAAAKK